MPVHLLPISFNECLNKANQYVKEGGISSEKHLMLGNGFSIALFPNIFSYASLAGLASPQINNLFNRFGTKDFEHVMRRLTTALEVVNIYSPNSQPANQMQIDLDELRTTLIDAISQLHPETLWDIDNEHYEKCHKFLNHFESGNKYTFNYDLLLYWVYMRFLGVDEKRLQHGDGFSRSERGAPLTWRDNPPEPQNVYYLHGAMHFFENNRIISKLKGTDNNIPLQNQVRNKINRGKYPMFISEGTKDHKRLRIQNSTYLKHAFDSLDDIKDNLFIFGHSLGDEDDHVFNQVNSQSDLKNIFISIHGDINSGDNQLIVNKVRIWEGNNSNKHYYFYDTVSADMWGPQAP